jgi:hypothetical protein
LATYRLIRKMSSAVTIFGMEATIFSARVEKYSCMILSNQVGEL